MIIIIIIKCSKLVHKEDQTKYDWAGWKICARRFSLTNKCYKHNPKFVMENETQTSRGFWDTICSPNIDQTTSPINSKKKKKYRIMNFAVPADHRVKLIENEKTVHHHHHHHVTPPARISLTLSLQPFLSSIDAGRSSRLHPVSAESCCM